MVLTAKTVYQNVSGPPTPQGAQGGGVGGGAILRQWIANNWSIINSLTDVTMYCLTSVFDRSTVPRFVTAELVSL